MPIVYRMTQYPLKRVGSGPMRLGILTSVETRHRHFASSLASRFNVGCIVYAKPGYQPAKVDDSDLSDNDRAVVAAHFAERGRQEERFFGHAANVLESTEQCHVAHVGPGELNDSKTVEILSGSGVNTIAVFGTDLIRPPLLAPDRWTMINLHLGLSPWYRGTATNFYPLLNEEPEFVGATIHVLDSGIDSGAILRHARPKIEEDDQPHTIGCKAIAAGIRAMIEVLSEFEQGCRVIAVEQWKEPAGRLYLRRDYHPRDVVDLYRKWNGGMLKRCLRDSRSIPNLVLGSKQPCSTSSAHRTAPVVCDQS